MLTLTQFRQEIERGRDAYGGEDGFRTFESLTDSTVDDCRWRRNEDELPTEPATLLDSDLDVVLHYVERGGR